MMTTKLMPVAANNDAELVVGTLAGNRDAFSHIVSRYQSLICSLTYSATGNLGQSEDLAQETFITAWKHLSQLRERDKLRSWLCGIARNRINNFLRREGREPLHQAGLLEEASESHSPEPLPVEYTISNEEQAILWRSLERIPEIYREPLVLFYREHQSIESVAQSLELTEDTVKQRLSRGRKMLHEQVLAFVEGALGRTNPGEQFTLNVMVALSATLATSAKVAALGTAAKTAGPAVGVLAKALLTPALALLGGFSAYKLDVEGARTPQIRRFIIKIYAITFLCFVVCMGSLLWLTRDGLSESLLCLELLAGWGTACGILWLAWSLRKFRLQQMISSVPAPTPVLEYRSKANLLGMPLVHVRLRGGLERGPVVAWLAAGDSAIGGLAAFGAVAIAPISFGGFSVGLLALGGFALGAGALGVFSAALWSFGVFALGWQAFGHIALAWDAAQGDAALAHGFALGNLVHAAQANTEAANAYIQSNRFFQAAKIILRHLDWLNLAWALPVVLWWRATVLKRRMKQI